MILAAIVILSTAVAGVFVGFLLGRDLLHSRGWIYVSVGLLIAGLALTLVGANRVTDGWQRRTWPSATGTIVESRVEGVRAFHPEVVYEYMVEGIPYRDSTILHQPSFGGKRKRYDVATTEAALYAPGDTVSVFYDPAAPRVSDLVTSIFWADYATTGVGGTLLAMAACFGLAWLRRRPPGSDSSLDSSAA